MDAIPKNKDSLSKETAAPDVRHREGGFLDGCSWMQICSSLQLSKREAEICNLALKERTEQQIAHELGISAHTVHTHFERLYRKLGVRSRCQLIVCLFRTYMNVMDRSPRD